MTKHRFDCAFSITQFKDHNRLKQRLLDLIETSDYSSPNIPSAEVNITRTDWHKSSNFDREWAKEIAKPLGDHMLEVYKDLGYDGFTLHELWFQQYLKNSGHGWHTHSANFTNVYYLELPTDAPKTQIVNSFNQTEIIEVDVKEGDILVFPSFVVHRATPNLCNKRKTIISYNTNVIYSDNIYGTGLA
jgi:predicted 2-oxoglutarate/Fe(II)-dependent dioxygenase YbiX